LFSLHFHEYFFAAVHASTPRRFGQPTLAFRDINIDCHDTFSSSQIEGDITAAISPYYTPKIDELFCQRLPPLTAFDTIFSSSMTDAAMAFHIILIAIVSFSPPRHGRKMPFSSTADVADTSLSPD